MTSRRIDCPQPGYYTIRLVRGGPVVPAEIRHGPSHCPETGGVMDERSYLWEAIVNGKVVADGYQPLLGGPFNPSPDYVAAGVHRIWEFGQQISEADCRYLLADRDWSAKYAPGTPEAQPTKRATLGNQPPAYFMPRRGTR